MKKLLLFLAVIITIPTSTIAAGSRADIDISVPLPPPIIFPVPPNLVVIPETDIYGVVDIDVDIFFYGGWWWRPWEGRWNRSHRHDSGWGHYDGKPPFYDKVPPGWKKDYKQHRWQGYQWNYQRVPYSEVEKNWNKWEKDKYWEKHNYWGVQDMKKQKYKKQQSKHPRSQHQNGRRSKQGDSYEKGRR